MPKKFGTWITNEGHNIEEDEPSDPMENESDQSTGDEISSENAESGSEGQETLSSNEEGPIEKKEFSLTVFIVPCGSL